MTDVSEDPEALAEAAGDLVMQCATTTNHSTTRKVVEDALDRVWQSGYAAALAARSSRPALSAADVARHLGDVAVSIGRTTVWSYDQALALVTSLDSLRRSPQPTPSVSAERVDELVEVMHTARYPEGYWEQGHSDPPEADDETVVRAILAALGIEVTP